jgi:hypothetical protein
MTDTHSLRSDTFDRAAIDQAHDYALDLKISTAAVARHET